MSDTEIIKAPRWKQEPKMTDSQVVNLKDVPDSVRQESKHGQDRGEPAVSIIGESLHFKGELSAGEDLIIEGTVEGTIDQGSCCLTLKPKGKIIANVNATKIFIEGTVEGDLHATVSVTVRESGKVSGSIIAPTVAITEGATFNGSIEMRDPTAAPKKKK